MGDRIKQRTQLGEKTSLWSVFSAKLLKIGNPAMRDFSILAALRAALIAIWRGNPDGFPFKPPLPSEVFLQTDQLFPLNLCKNLNLINIVHVNARNRDIAYIAIRLTVSASFETDALMFTKRENSRNVTIPINKSKSE